MFRSISCPLVTMSYPSILLFVDSHVLFCPFHWGLLTSRGLLDRAGDVFILIAPICILYCTSRNVVLTPWMYNQDLKLKVCLAQFLYTATSVSSFISDMSLNEMSPAFCPAETRDRVWFIIYVSRYNYVSWVLSSCPSMCAFPDYVDLGFHCLLQLSL